MANKFDKSTRFMLHLSLFKKQTSYIWCTNGIHRVKSVRVWSFSGPYLPVLRLNTELAK